MTCEFEKGRWQGSVVVIEGTLPYKQHINRRIRIQLVVVTNIEMLYYIYEVLQIIQYFCILIITLVILVYWRIMQIVVERILKMLVVLFIIDFCSYSTHFYKRLNFLFFILNVLEIVLKKIQKCLEDVYSLKMLQI